MTSKGIEGWNISNWTTFPCYFTDLRPMSVYRALGIKSYNIKSAHWSLLDLDKLSKKRKATTIYKQEKEIWRAFAYWNKEDVRTMHR